MVFSIDFLKAATIDGLARQNKYVVYIVDPFGSIFGTANTIKLAALCKDSEIPGKSLATSERQTYGPTRKMPYQEIYNDITMTFLCANFMLERRFFDRWQNKIVDTDNHYFEYQNNYATQIVITNLSEDGLPTYNTLLTEAYPVTVNSQTLSYEANDSIQSLTVTFAYHKWLNDEQFFVGEKPSDIIPGVFDSDSIANGARIPGTISSDSLDDAFNLIKNIKS